MEKIPSSESPEFIGPPEPIAVTHKAMILPSGKAHMALLCWEAFAWQHLGVQNLRAKEEDVHAVHGALARMVFDVLFPDHIFTPHYLVSFRVGRGEDATSKEGNRWRLRELLYRAPIVLEGETYEAEETLPLRLMMIFIGHYDA